VPRATPSTPGEMRKQIADEVAILKAAVSIGSVGLGSDVSMLPAEPVSVVAAQEIVDHAVTGRGVTCMPHDLAAGWARRKKWRDCFHTHGMALHVTSFQRAAVVRWRTFVDRAVTINAGGARAFRTFFFGDAGNASNSGGAGDSAFKHDASS
jgi:hypothetical protein